MSQRRVSTCTICVVVAFVNSVTSRPRERRRDEIRDHQQAVGRRRKALLDVSGQLKERVEWQELDAGAGENLLAGHAREDARHDVFRAAVAIRDRIFEQAPVAIDEAVVHAPAVDADAGHLAACGARALGRDAEPRANLAQDGREVPAQVTAHLARGIAESSDLVELEAAGPSAPVKTRPLPAPRSTAT